MFRNDVNEVLDGPDLASAVAVNCWSGLLSLVAASIDTVRGLKRGCSVCLERPCISPSTKRSSKVGKYFKANKLLPLCGTYGARAYRLDCTIACASGPERGREIEKFVPRPERWMFSIPPELNGYHKVNTIQRWKCFYFPMIKLWMLTWRTETRHFLVKVFSVTFFFFFFH